MDRYVVSVGTIQRSRMKSWLRKELKKHEKLNLVTQTMVTAEGKSVTITLIFEEPLSALESQLELLSGEE